MKDKEILDMSPDSNRDETGNRVIEIRFGMNHIRKVVLSPLGFIPPLWG